MPELALLQSGKHNRRTSSPPQGVYVVKVNGPIQPVQRDQYGEPNSSLRSGQRNGKQGKDLPVNVRLVCGEGYQVDVGAVEQKLNAHHQLDTVSLGHQAVKAYSEHDGGKQYVKLHRYHKCNSLLIFNSLPKQLLFWRRTPLQPALR